VNWGADEIKEPLYTATIWETGTSYFVKAVHRALDVGYLKPDTRLYHNVFMMIMLFPIDVDGATREFDSRASIASNTPFISPYPTLRKFVTAVRYVSPGPKNEDSGVGYETEEHVQIRGWVRRRAL
jgi:hypothetical protein